MIAERSLIKMALCWALILFLCIPAFVNFMYSRTILKLSLFWNLCTSLQYLMKLSSS
jgi:hypothetical protein